ncbi:MAG: DUF6597 domain-containing transcriptional factor [Calditrichia bacterium]
MYQEITPLAPLNRFIDAFWHYSNSGSGDETIIYPDCCADLIFLKDSSSTSSYVTGVMTNPKPVGISTPATYIGVRFKPGFAKLFIDNPLSDFTDQTIPFSAKSSESAFFNVVHSDVATAHELFTALGSFLFNRLANTHSFALEKKIRHIASLRDCRVTEMADALGTSRRTLHRLFLEHFGLSPTQYSNIKRFDRFRKVVRSKEFTSLADLAIACGYYDQSDMTNHVRKISGKTPGAFLSQLYKT